MSVLIQVPSILLGINIEQCSSPQIGGILHNYKDKKYTYSINTQHVMNTSFKSEEHDKHNLTTIDHLSGRVFNSIMRYSQ